MDRPIIDLPSHLLYLNEVNWTIDWREQSVGTGSGGRQSVLLGKLPRWVGSLAMLVMPDKIGGLRARMLHGRGKLALFRVRMVDPEVNFIRVTPLGCPFSGSEPFDDGASFDGYPIAECPGGASIGDSYIDIDPLGNTVYIGQILSYNDLPFSVTWTETLPGTGLTRLGVEMPIRSSIPAGEIIELVGRGIFEYSSDPAGLSYSRRRIAEPVLTLQEWLR